MGVESYFLAPRLILELKYPLLSDCLEYAIVGIGALFVSLLIFLVLKKIQLQKLKLITFSIKLAVDGSYHYVQAPSAMLATDFLVIFIRYLNENCAKGKYNIVLKQYFPLLEISRNDIIVRIKENKSLQISGL